MNRCFILAPLMCSLIAPLSAMADTGSVGSVQNLATLQSKEATLNVVKKVKTLQLQIMKLNQKMGGGSGSSSSRASTSSSSVLPRIGSRLPRVISIEGMEHHLVATVSTAGGGSMEVMKGDFLPGKYRVIYISSSGVEVYRNHRRHWLSWGTNSGTQGIRYSGVSGIPSPSPIMDR